MILNQHNVKGSNLKYKNWSYQNKLSKGKKMRKHYEMLLESTMISLLHYGKISSSLSFFKKYMEKK